jgi:hypothetical protein
MLRRCCSSKPLNGESAVFERALLHVLPAILIVNMTVACSETPTSPSLLELPDWTPSQRLTVTGVDLVVVPGRPLLAACRGLGPSGLTASVTADVIVQRDGDSWRVVPASRRDGSFDLRLRHAGTRVFGAVVTLGGTIRGFVNNMVPQPAGQADVRVTFDTAESEVAIDGEVSAPHSFAAGVIHGPVTFSRPDGPSIDCAASTVFWQLSGPLLP